MKTSDVQFKVGLFGIGLDAYWPQFPGLRMRLVAFIEQVARRLEDFRVHVTNLGLIDTPEKVLLGWTRVPQSGCRSDFSVRHDLRAVVDRTARRSARQSAGNHS